MQVCCGYIHGYEIAGKVELPVYTSIVLSLIMESSSVGVMPTTRIFLFALTRRSSLELDLCAPGDLTYMDYRRSLSPDYHYCTRTS